ncbi:MAG TPA: potassium transporter TrkG [Phycisphaerae bacterium]|nr:potassium transporter TrkG [Phycisphaerae bacterium]HNU47152.1 potassium transporter TrkG [Phycisphaerae bacterium]
MARARGALVETDVFKAWRSAAASVWRFVGHLHPAKLVLLGYGSYITIGWLLLCLPFAHRGDGAGVLDHLFTATSAVSTTGLVTVSVADDYTAFGQVVVLLLIQLGGIGYMTLGSFVVLSRKSELSEARLAVGKTVFSLPRSFDFRCFLRGVVIFTVVIEGAGAAALYFVFHGTGEASALWSAVFHSVSAFCTAGFSLYNTSFEGFAGNFWVNAVVAVLSYLGAIGFIVCVDFWNMVTGRVKEMTLTSKIILWSTFWLSVVGTLLLLLGEPSIQAKPLDERLLAAFFQTMTAMTTVGYNTVSMAALSKASVLLLILLMVIGASPAGTGGGLKCTTFSAFLGVMRSALRGRQEVRFWGRPVPLERVWTAVGSLGFYLLALIAGTYLLELTEPTPFEQNFFEAASALGTVGLSMGITSALTSVGKTIIILLMFCGRMGPLTFGVALFCRMEDTAAPRDNDLAV